MTTDSDEGEFPAEIAAQFISVTEAARLSGLTPSFIRRLLRRGDIAGVKVGPRSWLTTAAAVREYLKRDRRPGPKPKG